MSKRVGNNVGNGVSELESRLLKTGAERLALLGKHAERLMQGYTRDDIPLEGLSDGALRKLLAARVLWRPDEQSGVKLSPKVRDRLPRRVSRSASQLFRLSALAKNCADG